MRIETKKPVHLGFIEGFDDIDFIEDFPAHGDGFRDDVSGVVDNGLDFDLGFVGFKLAAKHFDVAAERMVGVGA